MEPLVLVHPAGADASAFAPNLPALERFFRGPAHVLGCSDGATIALLLAVRRPELVRRLVVAAGVFHNAGWLPGVIPPELCNAILTKEPIPTYAPIRRAKEARS
jgi:pimeloyl-ACP methyl ester carboxylesterase